MCTIFFSGKLVVVQYPASPPLERCVCDSVEVLPVYNLSLVTRLRMYNFKTVNVNIFHLLVSSFTLKTTV